MTDFASQWRPLGDFGIVKASEVEGGWHHVEWDLTTYPGGASAAFAVLIPNDRRVTGMIVRSHETDEDVWAYYEWSGSVWNRYNLPDTETKGGFKSFEWTQGAGAGEYSSVSNALYSLVPANQRKNGMLVRMKEGSGSWTMYYWGGSGWYPFTSFAEVYGWGVIGSGLEVTDGGGANVNISAGMLVDWYGNVWQLDDTDVEALADGTRIVYKALGTGIDDQSLSTGLASMGHMPLAVVTVSGGNIVRIEDCRMFANGVKSKHFVSVDSSYGVNGGNFYRIRSAMLWMNCFTEAVNNPRAIRVIGDIEQPKDADFGGCISFDDSVDPFFSQANERLDGLKVMGHTDGSVNRFPRLAFGTGGEAFFLDTNFQGQNLLFAGLCFHYSGSINASNDDICVFRNLGQDGHVKNCIIKNDTNNLTHFAAWIRASGNIILGGLSTDNSNGIIFEDITCYDAIVDTNVLFHFSAPAGEVHGALTLRDCTFTGWNGAGPGGVVFLTDNDNGENFACTVQNMHIVGSQRDGSSALFDIPTDGQLQVSDSKFWYSNSTTGEYRDVINCENAVFVNCIYRNTQPINLGGTLYSNCKSHGSTPIVVANGNASMVNCDFGSLVHHRLIDPQDVENLVDEAKIRDALDSFESSAITLPSANHRTRVIQGGELFPYTTGGTSSGIAAFEIQPGVFRAASGYVQATDSEERGYFGDGDVPITPESIEGNSSWTQANGGSSDMNFFYCFLRIKEGEAPRARFSLLKPDLYGRPDSVGGADATAGYTVNDYVFVGTLTVFDCTRAIGQPLDSYFKGGAHVQHMGNGLRRFGIANLFVSSTTSPILNSEFCNQLSWSGKTTGSHQEELFDNSTKTEVNHCQAASMSICGFLSQATASADVGIHAPGLGVYFVNLGTGDSVPINQSWEVPLSDGDTQITLEVDTVSGVTGMFLNVFMNMFTENVNDLYRRGPVVNF